MILVYGIIITIMFLAVINKFFKKHWSDNLSVDIDLSKEEAMYGETLQLKETVRNTKWLPLPSLHIKFSIHKDLSFDNTVINTSDYDQHYKDDIFSVLFYQKIIRSHPFICKRRGYYKFDKVYVVSSGIFMDDILLKTYEINKTLMVYPEIIPSARIKKILVPVMGEWESEKYLYTDPFTFAGIRQYQQSDTMKMINWKATAKTGELRVNVNESSTGHEVMLMMNLNKREVVEDEVLKEKTIAICYSLIQHFYMKGIPVTFYTNGVDELTNSEISDKRISNAQQRKDISRCLSRIDLNIKRKDFVPFIKNQSIENDNKLLLFVSICGDEDEQKWFLEESEKNLGAFYVYVYNDDINVDFLKDLRNKVILWKEEA